MLHFFAEVYLNVFIPNQMYISGILTPLCGFTGLNKVYTAWLGIK